MKDSINRESLLRTINLIRPALSSQPYIPALTHIAFDGVTASAYNDITGISVRCDLDMEICLPGELLIKGLNSFGSEEVLIQPNDAGVVLASGRSKLKLPTLPLSDHPFHGIEHQADSLAEINITAEILSGIERCLISVGDDPTHPAQMGVTLEECMNHAVLYSTDNYSISRAKTKTKISLPGNVPVILPTFFCTQLIALAKAIPGEEIVLGIYSGYIRAFIGDQAELFTKLPVDLEPMDLVKIFAKHASDSTIKEIAADIPASFEDSFNRAMLILSGEADKATKITCSPGKLKLFSSSSAGEAEDSMGFKDDNPPPEPFFVDPILVLRASKVCSQLALLDGVLALTSDDHSFIHLIAHCAS